MATKLSVEISDQNKAEVTRIIAHLKKITGKANISDAIRFSIMKAAKGLPR